MSFYGAINVKDPNEKIAFIKGFMDTYKDANSYTWRIIPENELKEYDIDLLFKIYREDSGILKLFDKLIETLEKIIESGEIDSFHAIDKIKELINTLKANKSGSYLAARASVDISVQFAKRFMVNLAKESPIIGTFVTSFDETVNEMDREFQIITEKINVFFKQKFGRKYPLLQPPDEKPSLDNSNHEPEKYVNKPNK